MCQRLIGSSTVNPQTAAIASLRSRSRPHQTTGRNRPRSSGRGCAARPAHRDTRPPPLESCKHIPPLHVVRHAEHLIRFVIPHATFKTSTCRSIASTSPGCCANRCIAPIPPLGRRARDRCARPACCASGAFVSVAPRRPRPEPPIDSSFAPRHVLMSTLLHSKCPLVSERFWRRHRETLRCSTDISSISLTRRAANAHVLGLVRVSTTR